MLKLLQIIKEISTELIKGNLDRDFLGFSIDTRSLRKGEVFVAIKGSRFDGHSFLKEAQDKGAVALIVEKLPLIPLKIPVILVKDTVKSLGEIAHVYRRNFAIPLIAITGSNGKTTTKEILAHLLGLRYKVLKNYGTQNNQIGVPLTLLRLNRNYDFIVVEFGTNHFGEIEYLTKICSPNIGIVLNIGCAHLEFFGDLRGVYKEKISLINNLTYPYIGILNSDDPFLKMALQKIKDKFLLSFGVKNKSDFYACRIKTDREGVEFYINKKRFHLNTLGGFNVYNALAAISVCRIFGFDYDSLIEGLKSFKFPEQRLQIKRIKGITFIDDTYNSNPNSLKEAVKVLEMFKIRGRKIFVLGDMLELGSKAEQMHIQIIKCILKICDIIIGTGKFFGKIDRIAKEVKGRKALVFCCANSQQAKDILFKEVRPKKDDIVLVKGSRLMRMEEVLKV